MRLTTLQLVMIAVAMGIGGILIGKLIEDGLESLKGWRYWLACGVIFVALGTTAVLWLLEDLQRARVI